MSLKIAFVGAGSIAQNHFDALRYAGAEVVGVCTRGESGKLFAEKNRITYRQMPEQLMEDCQPDALFLLTQPSAYVEVLARVQPYGLPVFIEKPLGNTVREAEALREFLLEKVFVGLNRRFYSNIRPLLPMLSDEPPFMTQVVMPEREKDYGQYPDAQTRNHWDMLQGIHLIDLITYLAGPLKNVLGGTHWGALPLTEVPQYTMTLYETERKHRVSFLSNFDSPGGWRIHFFLPKKEIIVSPLEKTLIRSLSGLEELPVSELDQKAKPGFIAQAQCFLDGVQSQALPSDWVSFDDALTSMRTLEALFQAKVPVA
ncbi:MAG TPA: Gfo/Idh/MocA family oxidoreductase [Oculatellaceae cyanobacterium]|jgi:predicted dehydrogenase